MSSRQIQEANTSIHRADEHIRGYLKKGSPYRKLGRRPAYDPVEIQKWDEAQKVLTE